MDDTETNATVNEPEAIETAKEPLPEGAGIEPEADADTESND